MPLLSLKGRELPQGSGRIKGGYTHEFSTNDSRTNGSR
ncbi:hypothetical protein ABB02_01276 [Clostridiaceae bacterium JG1575]|nr:hypothetical protein ABB02_01276 [Clostridiaceae bacterium JG1575]